MFNHRSILSFASIVSLASAQVSLFSFGDSYTATAFDINGVQPSPGNALGNPAYGLGTFSGGPNYIDFLVANYNKTLVLSYNFAYPAATISNSVVPSGDHTFQDQVEQLFQSKYSTQKDQAGGWQTDSSIFSIFFGINDVGNSYKNSDPKTRVPQLLDAYFQYADELYADGARRFLFIGVPPFERSPPYSGLSAQEKQQCSDFINEYNGALAQRISDWVGANPDADISIYDYHAWMTKVLDSPQDYGFQDATCSGDGTSKCVWWQPNNLHTTSTLNDLMAQDMLPSLRQLGWP